MRAVLVDNQKSGAEKLYIGEVETPEPGNEQVLVKV
jgi:NADPH:quinone reductase-like Zn-dependent oxidoreductase